jgi:hypothetical protein
MNFILGRLIKYLSEEEAFWVFTMLIECILPLDFFTQMIGVATEAKIFSALIQEYLPQINKQFRLFRFDSKFFSLNWFICLFTDKLTENVLFLCIL